VTNFRSLSITVRLASLFTCVAVLTFAAVGAYLYQALAHEIERRDDAELIGKVALVRHLLLEVSAVSDIAKNPHPFVDSVFGHAGLVLLVTDAAGRTLVQSDAPSRPLPLVDPVMALRAPVEADVQTWQAAAGEGRLVSAVGRVGGTASDDIRIIVAREGSHGTELLRDYGRNLLLAICFGAALSASLGFIVVRLGLRPLRSVIGKANEISTHRLNTRLSVDDAPAELRELGVAFNAMLARLEEGVQRLSRFAADLAHDLRTPINTLMGETQVALTRARSVEEYQVLLASNIEEYEWLARMIENTLFLARAENAELAVHRERLHVKTELARIGDYFEGLAEEAAVTLTVEADDGAVSADPVLFQRAVSNLVANAIQHTPPGGAVRLSAVESAEGLSLTVENSGPSIPSEHLPFIFDRYYRVDPARSTSSQSSGLGLAIVRAIMRLHGGEVHVRSVDGQKTSFTLQFKKQPG
jgi:two-component system heavy metal sensor histidine kinase CusS